MVAFANQDFLSDMPDELQNPQMFMGGETDSTVLVNGYSDHEAIRPGQSFIVAVEKTIEDKWHTYWKNPGEIGLPTEIEWELPDGFSQNIVDWPIPIKYLSEDILSYGYTKKVTFLFQFHTDKNTKPGSYSLKSKISWLACKESCIPGDQDIQINIKVASAAIKNKTVDQKITQAKSTLPSSQKLKKLFISTDKNKITILWSKENHSDFNPTKVYFFPEGEKMIDIYSKQSFSSTEKYYSLSMNLHKEFEKGTKVKGVLKLNDQTNLLAFNVDQNDSKHSDQLEALVSNIQNKPEDNTSTNPQETESPRSLFFMIWSAFLGGLILNLMPCVFPVISLKVMSFVKHAEQSRMIALLHASIFSLGIIFSFLFLAGVLLFLREAGNEVGWGFQLQEPIFVASLAFLLFLVTLNLFGVYEFGISIASKGGMVKERGGYVGSFLSGILTTIIATPCTAPFMGVTLGFAVTQPTPIALLIFFFLGLGMASPYILLSASEKLSSFMPKPGNWMVTFKHIMGFLVLFSVIWLFSVYNAQTSPEKSTALLIIFAFTSLGAWIYGKWGIVNVSKKLKFIAQVSAVLFIILPITYFHFAKEVKWENWSPEKEQQLIDNKQAYFIDFTAKWCLSCQSNKIALHSDKVLKAFASKNITPLKADWTKFDPAITKKLAKYQRNGIPFYLLVDSKGDISTLPELLSSSIVLDAIEQID